MNRNRLILYAALVLTAAIFNGTTQLAMAAGNDNEGGRSFVGNATTITNTGGEKWIVYAAISGPLTSLTNSMITTDDGTGDSRILAEAAATNTLDYTDYAAAVKWPKNATVTYKPSGPAWETNRCWLLTVSERPR